MKEAGQVVLMRYPQANLGDDRLAVVERKIILGAMDQISNEQLLRIKHVFLIGY
jgi:hypothetical protein